MIQKINSADVTLVLPFTECRVETKTEKGRFSSYYVLVSHVTALYQRDVSSDIWNISMSIFYVFAENILFSPNLY